MRYPLISLSETIMRTHDSRTKRAVLPMYLLLLAMLLGSQGCATTHFTDTTQLKQPIMVRRVYVYSFLDVRAPDLGREMMSEIRRQLGEALEARGVAVEQHWFRDDALADEFDGWRRSVTLPVREVIEGNAAAERRFEPDYRLIALPTRTDIENETHNYDFAWILQDPYTNRHLWSTTSRSSHVNLMLRDERPAIRAQKIVDGLIAQMELSGVLRAGIDTGASR